MAKKRGGIIWIEYTAARLVFGLLGLLPRAAAIRISTWILLFVLKVLTKLRKTGLRNLEIAFPEKTIAERETILRGTFENLGRVLGDLSQVHKYSREKMAEIFEFELATESERIENLHISEGQGVLLTTGHLGNWEILALGISALYKPITFIARPLDNRMIDEMLTRRRARFGNRSITKRNSLMGAIKLLREGELLGILSDVNAGYNDGVFVPFFGTPACTSIGPALMALRSNSLIFPVFSIWDRIKKRYVFVHGDVIEPANTGNKDRDLLETTIAITHEIEKMIRAYPDQWMWIHRRWKTRPPGEPDIY